MAGSALTTRQVASLLSVSEATIKRWADDEVIRSEKTVGGHRRFGLEEVARFQRERGAVPPSHKAARAASSAARREFKERTSPTELFRLLTAGDEAETAGLLMSAYLHGERLAHLFDRVVTPAMHQIGDHWCRGELTIADEHLATQTALAAVRKLRGIIHVPTPTTTKALICGVEGDLHELPIHLLHTVLIGEGWEVINLGANTPFFTLVEALARHRPQLLCISAKLMTDPDRAARDYNDVRKAATKLHTAIAWGGDGLADSSLRKRFPSDFYAENFEQLLGFARSLTAE